MEIGTLTNAMLRVTANPRSKANTEVAASLDRLARLPIQEGESVRNLTARGRLIIATLPVVNHLVARLLAAPMSERTRAVRSDLPVMLTDTPWHSQYIPRFAVWRGCPAEPMSHICSCGYRPTRSRFATAMPGCTQAQKLEAIGTLAGGIAHEFNNILGAILGHAEVALEFRAPAALLCGGIWSRL